MRPDQRNEILILYVGYFLTLAFMLIPVVSWYAMGALVLQTFYALIRYMSSDARIFRSHLYNYLLGVGVSLLIFLIILIQVQAMGLEVAKFIQTQKFDSATSLPYIGFMLLLEMVFAIFWPIVLIIRGFFLIGTGRPVFAGFASEPDVSRTKMFAASSSSPSIHGGSLLLSGILSNGSIIKASVDASGPPRVIGRDYSDAQIVIGDDSVSRRHAIIESQNGQIVVRDLGSTNGTKLNGRDIGFAPEPLRPSDTLKIGNIQLSVSSQ